MKPAPFDYRRPRALEEACDMLASCPGARVIAGGQSLGPMLNLRLARPETLVDISRLAELARFEETESGWRLGACVTHAELEDSREIAASAPMVADVAAGIAYRSVRNLGTIGGSLAHADPAADWPLALAALGATIQVRARGGQARRIAADAFMQAAFTTDLRDDEIVELVEVPKHDRRSSYGYFKFCRKQGEFPEASAAVVRDSLRGTVRMFVGALGGAPKRAAELENAVAKEGPGAATKDAVRNAVAAVAPELDGPALAMHAAALDRAIRQAFRP